LIIQPLKGFELFFQKFLTFFKFFLLFGYMPLYYM
jgi:hypothetical protein